MNEPREAVIVAAAAGIVIVVALFVVLFLAKKRGDPTSLRDRRLAKVRPVLTKDEKIEGFARQVWLLAPFHQDLAVVTNRRLIFFRPKRFGRMSFTDFLWQEVDDVKITVQALSATLMIEGRRLKNGQLVPLPDQLRGLQKLPAQQVYALAQEVEEEWREKNRVRRMEEERAQSGGTVIHQPWPSTSSRSTPQPPASDVRERLSELKKLYQEELISAAEYETRKAQIIADT